MNPVTFVPLKPEDLSKVKEIYDWYITNSTSTFHTQPITTDLLKEFIYFDHPLYASYLIYETNVIVGYCLLTSHKKRQAYDRTAEITIYLHHQYRGRGAGKQALKYLEEVAFQRGIKNLLGVITGDNRESIALFERCGYTKCAHFKNVGEKFSKVLDVVAYQKEI